MRRFMLLLGFVTALALAGCGGGDDEGSAIREAATGPQRSGAISFAHEASSGDASIFTIDPNGGDLRLLVTDASTRTHTWSADGQLLAYESDAGISILDVATQRRQQVRVNDVSPWTTVLSPDGKQLAFTRLLPGIWTAPVATGEPRRLTSGDDDDPRWSPDGRSISFERGQAEIWVVDADGGKAREIASADWGSDLSWSPDSRRIAYVESNRLRVVEVASCRVLNLAPSLRADTPPVWSPDGRRLALRQESTLALEKGTFVSRQESTYVVHVASGAVRRVMGSVGKGDYTGYLSWSPDGTRLALSVDDELWVVRADGTGKKRLLVAAPGYRLVDAQWHPGGLRSAALGGKPVATLAPVVHVNALGDTYSACGIELWQPDGSRWLVAGEGNTGRAYAKPLRPGVWQILDGKRDALGQAVATNSKQTRWNITDARGRLVGIAQSRDGPWIALVLLWGGVDCVE